MKKTCWFALAVLLFTGAAHAEDSAAITPNLRQGNFAVGGSAFITSTTGAGANITETSLSPYVEYFFIDGLSAGATFSLDHQSVENFAGYTTVLLGPSATYHYLGLGRIVPKAHVRADFGLNDDTIKSRLGAAIGVDYFVTPSVGFGPSVFFTHYNSRHDYSYQRTGLEFDFSIYF